MATRAETTNSSAVLIDHLARRNRQGAAAALAPLGLRPRHLVALTVLREHGAISQQGLADAVRIDRTNLVGLLNELETQGLVQRVRATGDRRRHVVDLTDEGRARLHEAECALAVVENEVLAALDADQRDQLYRLLQVATAGYAAECTGE